MMKNGSFIRGSAAAVALLLTAGAHAVPSAGNSYALFESDQVRPLAMSPDGDRLFSVNTPGNKLEIFRVTPAGLEHESSVTVGLEPVALAVRSSREVWVVNHLSDSISIVDVQNKGVVAKTLLVGDEPRDIVFAGSSNRYALITTAHRGQNSPVDPGLTTPGIGRADVWVFDSNAQNSALLATPLTIINLFTDTPRAMAVSENGDRVYVAGFKTGNRTTTVFEELIPDGGLANGGLPSTRTDAAGVSQPETGLIVKYDGTHWVDELGRSFDANIKFNLPDKDVFVIDTSVNPPRLAQNTRNSFANVGTVLFNMAVNPKNKAVYVTNTEALNERRFEGHGARLGRDHTVQGHFIENRISVIKNGEVRVRHLNKHIDYAQCCAPVPNPESVKSIAQPMGMAISKNGKTLYVAAFGSSKVAVFDTAALENDSFVPSENDQITLSDGGPSGLVLDEARSRLYVMTRFNNKVTVIDLNTRKETQQHALYNPEPAYVRNGRRFLYDASYTSSHGDSSCSSCHVFGDMDNLAWDLGNPDATSVNNPGPFRLGPTVPTPDGGLITFDPTFKALKGPMVTQSLHGMANHGPMHWRGDRTGGNAEASVQPDSGSFDERQAFAQFNPAFVGLVGRSETLTYDEMEQFTDFVLDIVYPPNPIRNLDNSLTAQQQAGMDIYFGNVSDGAFNCGGCHTLDADGNREYGVKFPGFYGTSGFSALIPEPQFMKIPQLRNMYQKVGMFGMDQVPSAVPGDTSYTGDQIRGFGFIHDGSVDTIFRFMGAQIFAHRETGALGPFDGGNPGGFPFAVGNDPASVALRATGEQMRRNVEQFLFAYPTNMAPIIGQQVTVGAGSSGDAWGRVDLLRDRADQGECDLVVTSGNGNVETGYLYQGNGMFQADSAAQPRISVAAMRDNVIRNRMTHTYMCVPVGSGMRIALDRDENGVLNGDEPGAAGI